MTGELIGYLASFLVAISLLMVSIVKLRLINLAGSIVFIIYGFLHRFIPDSDYEQFHNTDKYLPPVGFPEKTCRDDPVYPAR